MHLEEAKQEHLLPIEAKSERIMPAIDSSRYVSKSHRIRGWDGPDVGDYEPAAMQLLALCL